MFTDKLVFRWLEGFGAWSLDSASPVTLLLATIAYPANASGSSTVKIGGGGVRPSGGYTNVRLP